MLLNRKLKYKPDLIKQCVRCSPPMRRFSIFELSNLWCKGVKNVSCSRMSRCKLLGLLVINVVQVALSTQDSKIRNEQDYKRAESGWNDVIYRRWSWFLTFSTRGSSNRNGGRERALRNRYIGLRGSAWCQPFRATHQWKSLFQPCKRTEIIDVQE